MPARRGIVPHRQCPTPAALHRPMYHQVIDRLDRYQRWRDWLTISGWPCFCSGLSCEGGCEEFREFRRSCSSSLPIIRFNCRFSSTRPITTACTLADSAFHSASDSLSIGVLFPHIMAQFRNQFPHIVARFSEAVLANSAVHDDRKPN
jgi:hypothetical protein